MSRRALSIIAVLPFAASCHDRPVTAPATNVPPPTFALGASVPDQYIVVLRPGVGAASTVASSLVAALGGELRFVYDAALSGFAARLSPAALDALRRDPRVAYIEPDQLVHTLATQTPVPSWGLDRIDQRNLPLNNRYTWNASAVNVHVYIIDTGIRITHTNFGGRASHGFDAIDGRLPADDCHGHGTHVAGIVGSTSYGVAKQVRLHAVRVLDCGGTGTVSQVVAGINWVTANAVKPAVANMSLGGLGSAALDQAVANSVNAGIVHVVAAGNSNTDACGFSPARAPLAVTVGSADIADRRSSSSNVGPCVDIYAPGVSITSTWNSSNTATMTLSGTSMASPHVAGAAALYLHTKPNATPANVTYALLATATRNVLTGLPARTVNALLYTGFFNATPGNLPPLARFGFSCNALTCTFNSTPSQDDVGITGRSWTFGDGGTASSVSASHTYATAGTYTTTLTVRDAANLTSTLSKSFTLPAAGGPAGRPPIADFTAFPNAGTVDFDASLSTDDRGIGSYRWNFGDGTTGSGRTVRKVYSAPNQFYTVTLTVYDLAGQSSSKSISVYPNSH
jgi:subtilisin family serine protease